MSFRSAIVTVICFGAGAVSCGPDHHAPAGQGCQSDADCTTPPSACSSPTGACSQGSCTYAEAPKTQHCLDADGDGYPGTTSCGSFCAAEAPADYYATSVVPTDCDDTDATVSPLAANCPCTDGQTMTCNAGACNESTVTCASGYWPGCPAPVGPPTYCRDDDGDGFCTTCVTQCAPPVPEGTSEHWVEQASCSSGVDCDDVSSATHPDATELCDGIDNDCDGTTDEDCNCTDGTTAACNETACNPSTITCTNGNWPTCPAPVQADTYCMDADNDGWCTDSCVTQCSTPGGSYRLQSSCANGLDCHDANPNVHPDSTWAAYKSCSPYDPNPPACSVCDGDWVGSRYCQTNCQWSDACTNVTATRTWKGDDPALRHNCGAKWPWTSGGTLYCTANEWCSDTSSCEIVYGPYVSMPAGTYTVTFSGYYYGAQNWLLYGSWLDFDVYDRTTNTILASRPDYRVDSNRAEDVPITVTIAAGDQCHEHEFRERFTYGMFDKFDKVTVTRTSGNTYDVPYACVPGTWQQCTLPDGTCGDGWQPCNADGTSWGTCYDRDGQCAPRQGCPISRAQGHRTNLHNGRVPGGGQVCWQLEARTSEMINVNVDNAGGGYTIDLKRSNGALVASQSSFKNYVVSVKDDYIVCYRNNDWLGGASSFRLTFDVAAPSCDRNWSGCFGSRGPDCSWVPTFNTGCYGADESHDMLRWCPTSIGSNRHDSCCAHHPGGSWCGNVAYDGTSVSNENTRVCSDPSCMWAIPYLVYPNFTASYDPNTGGYQLCQKEWDMAWHDDADGHRFLGWYQWYDATQPFYRPAQIVGETDRGPDRLPFFDELGPTAGARLAPGGTYIRLIDAELGWCLGQDYGPNGDYMALSGDMAFCQGPGAPVPQ